MVRVYPNPYEANGTEGPLRVRVSLSFVSTVRCACLLVRVWPRLWTGGVL